MTSSLASSFDGLFDVLNEPNAFAWIENNTFFVGIQHEFGVEVLGSGDTMSQAMDAAQEANKDTV